MRRSVVAERTLWVLYLHSVNTNVNLGLHAFFKNRCIDIDEGYRSLPWHIQ